MPIEGRGRSSARLAAALVTGLLHGSPAQAILEGEPFIGARWVHDDNLFRFAGPEEALAENGNARLADVHRELSLGGAVQYTWGLQKAVAAVEYRHNDYRVFDDLNYDAWDLASSLQWQWGSRYTGEFRTQFTRELQSFEDRDSTQISLTRDWLWLASTRYALTPRWGLLNSLEIVRERFSLESQRFSDLDEVSLETGMEYDVSALTSLGGSLRLSRGHYPERNDGPGSTVASKYDQWEANWIIERVPSGLSFLRLEAGYTRRQSVDGADRDFGTPTGTFTYRRQWFGDLSSNLQLFRRVNSIEERDANFRLQTGAALRLEYRWSSRVNGFARYEASEADYEGSPAQNVGGQARKDTNRQTEIGLNYRVLWCLQLSGGAVWESRDSNRDGREYEDQRLQFGLEARYD